MQKSIERKTRRKHSLLYCIQYTKLFVDCVVVVFNTRSLEIDYNRRLVYIDYVLVVYELQRTYYLHASFYDHSK